MPSSSVPFRLLHIGLGNRGKMWAEIIDRSPDVVYAGVVDVSQAALDAFGAAHPDVPRFTDLATAIAATSPDAALLVTPPDGHLEQAGLIFDAGLALLAEKPLALNMPEAAEIVRLGQRAGLPLMVGLNFRYLPVSQKLRELVGAQVLGTPSFGHFLYQRNRDGRQPRLNKYPLTMEHPMMLEQSIHHLDLIRYCYGREVVQIHCRTWNPPWSMYAHDSNVACLLTLDNGMEVVYLGTWTGGWDPLEFQWRTDCAEGIIVQRQLHEDLAMARTTDTELTPIPLPPFRAFYDDTAVLLERFVAHIRDGAALESSGLDHLYSLALCFAGIESSATGRAVDLAEFYARHNLPPLVRSNPAVAT